MSQPAHLRKPRKGKSSQIEELETHNLRLAEEGAEFSKRFAIIERERDSAIKAAKDAKADAEALIASLTILADEFVPPQDRHSVGLRQFKEHLGKLSTHWYLLMGTLDACRYEKELVTLKQLMVEVRKQERPKGLFLVYLTPDDAEFFGDIFLYRLLLERGNWLEKSLIDFFQSQGADYSKWLNWNNSESAATNDGWERSRFCRARRDYRAQT